MEKIIRQLLDDMETEEVEADAGTVSFGLDGANYEIDLSLQNATKLRAHLAPFINAARPAGAAPRPSRKHNHASPPADHSKNGHSLHKPGGPSGYSSDQLRAIRTWARRNGYPELGTKGRVPDRIITAFEQSKGTSGGLFSAV